MDFSERYIKIGSFEQFWLAFVMYKKYNKVWNNEKEEWVEKEEN